MTAAIKPLKTIFTSSQARLQCIREEGEALNWIFLPGGPGLGSEYFLGLIALLDLPGRVWLLDLPSNGSYRPGIEPTIPIWKVGLKEALKALPNPVLVAHSFGGMLFQSIDTRDIEFKGALLFSTSPKPFTQAVEEQMLKRNLPDRKAEFHYFQNNPTEENFKHYCHTVACYWFTESSLNKGTEFINTIPMNHIPFLWAQTFYSFYRRQWLPRPEVPTWVVAGSEDHLTPLWLYDGEADFQQPWIQKRAVSGGAHFPWIEAPEATAQTFHEFAHLCFPR